MSLNRKAPRPAPSPFRMAPHGTELGLTLGAPCLWCGDWSVGRYGERCACCEVRREATRKRWARRVTVALHVATVVLLITLVFRIWGARG